MNTKPPLPPPPLLTTRDIFYILFRHKWKIITILLIAIVAAGVAFDLQPVNYTSEAKLLIHYVVDTKPLTENGADAQVTSVNLGDSGDSILNAEIEMIRSIDTLTQVATFIGPAKIVSKGPATNATEAAFLLQRELIPDREKGSEVIRLVFSNPNQEIVVPVLNEVIKDYQAKHDEVRRPKTGDDLLSSIQSIKDKRAEAENRLLLARKEADVISLDESKRAVGMTIEKTSSELNEVAMEREVTATMLKGLKRDLPTISNSSAAAVVSTPTATPEVPPAIVQEYKQDSAILTSLQAEEAELLSWTTTNNKQVQSVEAQIARTQGRCKQLEIKNPGLVAIKAVVASASNPNAQDPILTYNQALLKAETLEVRYQMLTNQLAAAHDRQNRILTAEAPLLDLQRECDLIRTTLDMYKQRQAQAEANGSVDSGNTQIRSIEMPTPPRGDYMAVTKLCTGILFGGFALAFGLPFFIELYLDQSLKRPIDIQNRLGVPFFISMPKLKKSAQMAALKAERIVPLLPAATSTDDTVSEPGALAKPEVVLPAINGNGNGNGHIAPWEQRHALRPFFETLRDRLMTYFEVINLTHKPKLVAITSCGEGAGVTTTAAGLASALSETGEGNVLLVNMNAQDGEAHHFYRGKLTCGLEEALERDKRNAACIHDNLFVAKDMEVNENLPRVLPKRFSHLVPKMRASDYDYIIFDMPPMSQISITPRLARFMDMVLLVVESEKTDRDVAKRATNLLLETKTNVGVVLNKSRDHLPRRLQQDI